jgi:hypothetical protein
MICAMAFQTDIYRVWYADVERGQGGRVGSLETAGQALKNGVSEVGARRINISGASAAGQTRSPDMAAVEWRLKPGRQRN